MKSLKSVIAANCTVCCAVSALAGFAAGFIAGKAVFGRCCAVKIIAGKAKKAIKPMENRLSV
ncbi:MAG: hypothetical protein IKX92_05670 [Clostridia bacterium]|nr:hypothetical protein [Clostridia bacterium]